MENAPIKLGRGRVLVTFADGSQRTYPVSEFTVSIARPAEEIEVHVDDLAQIDWASVPQGTVHVHADEATPIKPRPVAVPDLQRVVLYGAARTGMTSLRRQLTNLARDMNGALAEKAAPTEHLPIAHGPRARGKAQWKRERFTR